MKKTFFSIHFLSIGFLMLGLLNSCVNVKKLTYFNTIEKDSTANIQSEILESKIKKNDILQINVFTMDEVVTKIMNPNIAVSSATVQGSPVGYLVDENGIIKLPLLGSIKVEGLAKRDLATLLTNEMLDKKIAKDPVVSVRIVNYQVTILGEVAKPGVFPVPNERITLPEAIGQAGDLTIYGKRGNVLLIREVDGKRIYRRFNLNNQQVFDKDIYNLQNHDIIYVEPNHAKATTSDDTIQYLSLGFSIVSLLVLIYGQLIK